MTRPTLQEHGSRTQEHVRPDAASLVPGSDALVETTHVRTWDLDRPTLGQALIDAFTERGHDEVDAAREIATSRGNVRQWALDLSDPSPDYFDALANYLGLNVDEFGGHILRSQIRRFEIRVGRLPA